MRYYAVASHELNMKSSKISYAMHMQVFSEIMNLHFLSIYSIVLLSSKSNTVISIFTWHKIVNLVDNGSGRIILLSWLIIWLITWGIKDAVASK